MAMVTSRDVQEIVSKLSSDKAKAREEGIKLLNTWLEGDRSIEFCKILSQNSESLTPNQIPHSETWPFLITLLMKCVSLEISSSKKRLPKSMFAKTLRIVVQRAGDSKLSGMVLHILSVVKPLYGHICDVLREVPSFQSEYGIVLRHLLSVKDYRFYMRKKVYGNLVLLYMERVELSMCGKNSGQHNFKEEVFRCILTLHSLLENPPGDFPDNLREDVINNFIRIFSFVRDEGKISRKLIECLNTFLLKDGPNLGIQSLEIHDAVQQFVFRFWLTTHDQGLKDSFVLYARLQINLTRGAAEGSCLIDQVLDVVEKDLNQGNITNTDLLRTDTIKDDKFGNLTSSHSGLLELAALVFYRACLNSFKASSTLKRARREHAATHLKEGITNGKWLWNAAFCCLARKYNTRISNHFFLYWFEGICECFERILNAANMEHAYDGLLWTLRSLQELSSLRLLPDSKGGILLEPFLTSKETFQMDQGWLTIWSCLIHGLPTFSNVTPVADAALILLGNIISNDLGKTCIVPQDIWELQIFKRAPSSSLLYFISCYFSRRSSQGDLRDSLHLRQNLLRAVLSLLNLKEAVILNECVVMLLPAAVYALCSGFAILPIYGRGFSIFESFLDISEVPEDWVTTEENEQESVCELSEYSVDVLANLNPGSMAEVSRSQQSQSVRLPRQLRDPLLHEMETFILKTIIDKGTGTRLLPDIFSRCALLSNFIHYSCLTRLREERTPLVTKMGEFVLDLLNNAVSVIRENLDDIRYRGYLASNSIFDGLGSVIVAVRSFVSCPLFIISKDQNSVDAVLYSAIVLSVENLLKSLAKLYGDYSEFVGNVKSEVFHLGLSDSPTQSSSLLSGNKTRIMDMELDVNEDSNDMENLAVKSFGGISFSVVKWRLDMVSLISCFFSVLPAITWQVLCYLMDREKEPKVCKSVLYNLCQHPNWPSTEEFTNMVNMISKMIEMRVSLHCLDILGAIRCLLCTLLCIEKDKCTGSSFNDREMEQSLNFLGELISKVAENDLFDWLGRVKLIDCICDYIILSPQNGQAMIDKLLVMLHDPDYRARLSLARRIGVLFQTWDGHNELFQDICSSFSVKLVKSSRDNLVTAREVLAAGAQPSPKMETVIITLMHSALYSEKVELEAVFMMSVISAINPCQRELINVVLDNLSRQLQYATRSKYMDELVGSILFCWVSCGVSLVALVEIRDIFGSNVEPKYFMQYCCNWLLPALIILADTSNLTWVSTVAALPLAILVKNHFVSIFSVCMALYCSKKPGWEKGATILQNSILHFADMTEDERDKLIKKHMVSIVSHIFSLASCAAEPIAPFFSRDTIVLAIQTIVDGFMDMENSSRSVGVIDKIGVFRPDRVFLLIVEIHYKITAAVHQRHKCHRLAGLEALVNILGHRAAVSSTSNYLFNLVGQFFDNIALQDQCCRIVSTLLNAFKYNPSQKINSVLGEQLQFLVSKLVACYIPCEANVGSSGTQSSEVLSLLHQLTVDSDRSLYDYIRELEPFPELDIFDAIRKFHQELCQAYSPRDHFLKFVKRSGYLPPRLLLWSLQVLHNKLLMGEIFPSEKNADGYVRDTNWLGDDEIVHAVWGLVRIGGSDNTCNMRALVSDFISRVGIGNPHCVVFHLPGESGNIHVRRPFSHEGVAGISFYTNTDVSEAVLVAIIRTFKKYLMDDSAKIIDMTSQALRGILSTERGQRALQSFDSYERSIVEIHSKGVNIELVEKLLVDIEKRFNDEAISLDESTLWKTCSKTFEMWICPLVYSLVGYCDDVILRLCQDIIMMKAEVAELLLPSVFINLAGRKDMPVELHQLISLQVHENVFTESNELTKSIQVMLEALNELRICHLMERTTSSPVQSARETSKYAKPSSYGSKSRSPSIKAKDTPPLLSATKAISSWDKVYWLSIDYLVVAKSAISCGSYFTSVLYVEHWCEEHFNYLTLGSPDFSHTEMLPHHIEILVSAVTQVNEPDSLYGIVQSHKLNSQSITFEHEGNWSKALEYYDLQIRSEAMADMDGIKNLLPEPSQSTSHIVPTKLEDEIRQRKPYKGLLRSLQQIGCSHVLDLYCQGLISRKGQFQQDLEFTELQYEAAWRAGNWDFTLFHMGENSPPGQHMKSDHFNENLHSCLRTLHEGDYKEFQAKLQNSKQELVLSVYHASEESSEYIYSTIVKLQILYHLGIAWNLRWNSSPCVNIKLYPDNPKLSSEPVIPSMDQLSWLNMDWSCIMKRTQLHMNLLEPFVAFRRVLFQILSCKDGMVQHLLQAASILRKGSRFSQAAAALHELKFICSHTSEQNSSPYWLGRLEEAKLLRGQGQHEMALSLAKYVSENFPVDEESSNVYRLVGKWLAETRSSNSRTILEKYLKRAVSLAEDQKKTDSKSIARQSQTHFHLAHYADALFKSYEERLTSNEWQAAMRLRKHKKLELEALNRRLKSLTKGEKADYFIKIQELQKQLTMDSEEAEKLQEDRDNFLNVALEGYKRCLVIGDKYDVRVVFRLISLWFNLSSRVNVTHNMLKTIEEVQSYKFLPLIYQIASRMGSSKDGHGPHGFQFALVSLVKKMAIDHPYHTIFQLLALANGDRIKDKQRSRSSFVVDMDKKLAAENLLKELASYHGTVIKQMRQMVEVYIKLAELETKREDTNKRIALPRDIRGLRQLELVPVVTSTFPVDRSAQYPEGSFPYFSGLADSVLVMNGINAPKVVECLGSDGQNYRQLAKSGNDDLRQDAVMEQFFGLVNTFLQNQRDTWKRRLRIRSYKVVPFTPSAGVLEWVDGTLPLGEYLIGSMRNGGAHGRYRREDWSFLKCREHMANGKDKSKAFQAVCENFRPVMHYFFLERFLQPANWFEKRLAYTRSVAASSMVGYIVGLGDRHSMNILIDQATAEVVHIDLGVAFEQGLMLKTPEQVPFRLTRDIIDGMGVTGVEGVFRRCCEETLKVMRTNKEALLTIVEVFIHDPLYKWALSPLKALQRQKETYEDLESSLEDSENECEGNKDAARALMRVKQKLDGYEDGELRSVHGQVQQLIQDAIDSERLCQMFPGWGAWL